MFKDYYIKQLRIRGNGKYKLFVLESFNESKKLYNIRNFILQNIDQIINEGWGKFSKDFIRKHIIFAKRLLVLRNGEKIIAIAAASEKKIINKAMLYLEFTVVHPNFRGFNLLSKLNYILIRDAFLGNLFVKGGGLSLEVITITPNMRVLATLAKVASFIYPNPFEADDNGRISQADDTTYKIAQEIITTSDDPSRQIEREGLVLKGSYRNTPWLIHDQPLRHYNENINLFCKKYIEYDKRSDKEFIIRAIITPKSFLKLFYKVFKRRLSNGNGEK